MKKFIFSKFAGLQTYSRQLYYQMNSFTVFSTIFKAPHAPPSNFEESPYGGNKGTALSQHLWETLFLSRKSHLLSFLRDCIPHEHLRRVINCFPQFSFQTSMILFPQGNSMHILINIHFRIITKRSDFLFILCVNIRHQNTSYLF